MRQEWSEGHDEGAQGKGPRIFTPGSRQIQMQMFSKFFIKSSSNCAAYWMQTSPGDRYPRRSARSNGEKSDGDTWL